jgi:hypothetical protein
VTTENSEMKKDIKDGCPEWAESLIWIMYDIEVSNGNIVGKKDWTEGELSKFHEKVFKNENIKGLAEGKDVDQIFVNVAKGLTKEGFSPEKISGFINIR